ncbi:hypothetical protein [Natrinema gelatinilyticum]|uniref:hypothetical protein n=1 Tax=Natrinema gelatinilyticum TaxID=2961571 RepID=UPI0020C45151|nr:hypothetical protein [Natrinema gelatinilyticum]
MGSTRWVWPLGSRFPTPPTGRRLENLLIAISLTEFSVHYEAVAPELAEHTWQLAAERLLERGYFYR